MSKRLGTPYTRGKSDVIENAAPYQGAAIAEGLAVCKHTDGTIKAAGAAGEIIIGVSGMKEQKMQSFIRTGLEVYVRLASGATPAVGGAVYVGADGKFTSAAKTGEVDNTAVNAVFASVKETCIDSAGKTYDAAAIDFPGGL